MFEAGVAVAIAAVRAAIATIKTGLPPIAADGEPGAKLRSAK
jgi:hypothetical protein